MTEIAQHCPRCSAELDDGQRDDGHGYWCNTCCDWISNSEIGQHEAIWGDDWDMEAM